MRFSGYFSWTYLLYLIFVSCSFDKGYGLEMNDTSQLHHSACSSIQQQCLCRRRKKYEQTISCSVKDCLERLPTDKLSSTQAKEIVSLLITRQKNFTRIDSGELRRLGNLRHIRIFRCRISEIAPDAFIGLNNVERLDLHRNDLAEVPTAIRHLRHLKRLNLGGNRISYLTSDAFYSNGLLEKLVLGRNELTRIKSTFLPKNLIKLSLSSNKLDKIDDLRTFHRLKILNADRNMLKEFPRLPSSLKVLNLCWNQIDRPISLQNFPNLTAISINNNPSIGDITLSTFANTASRSSASKLTTFKARNAGIRSIDANSFTCLSRLQHLDISENLIHTYQSNWFVGNPKLASILVTSNPWSCPCDIKSNLENIANKFTTRRQKKNASTFICDFENEKCTNDGVSCGEFKLRRDLCPREDELDEKISVTFTRLPTPTKAEIQVEPDLISLTEKPVTRSEVITTVPITPPKTNTTGRVTTTIESIVNLTSTSSSSTATKPTTTSRTTTTREIVVTTTPKLFVRTTTSEPTTTSKTEALTTTLKTTTKQKEEQWCLQGDRRKCHFPFLYGGKEYNKCVGNYRAWCSATYNYDVDGKWDRCVTC